MEQACGGEQSVLTRNGLGMIRNRLLKWGLSDGLCVDKKVTVLCDQEIFCSEDVENVLLSMTSRYPNL